MRKLLPVLLNGVEEFSSAYLNAELRIVKISICKDSSRFPHAALAMASWLPGIFKSCLIMLKGRSFRRVLFKKKEL